MISSVVYAYISRSCGRTACFLKVHVRLEPLRPELAEIKCGLSAKTICDDIMANAIITVPTTIPAFNFLSCCMLVVEIAVAQYYLIIVEPYYLIIRFHNMPVSL